MTAMESKGPTESGAIEIMDREAIRRALQRISHEILERNPAATKLIIVGVPSRGVEIANRLAQIIGEIEKCKIDFGSLDVSMHRDDIALRPTPPQVRASHLPYDLSGRIVILVDDVFFTGRTSRAALDALHSYGRPEMVQLAVLVDRGHRELPIRPDYTGKDLPTARTERVMVRLDNVDADGDCVKLAKE